jgi:hypothetical protein
MEGIALLGAGCVLLVVMGLSTVVHELTHAMVLRALGLGYQLDWFPGQESQAHLNWGVLGAWATVTPQSLTHTVVREYFR